MRSILLVFNLPLVALATNLQDTFKRPVYSRVYNGGQYALADPNRKQGDRVNISQVATALAGLQPTYVSSTLYLGRNESVSAEMISDFNTLREAVPDAKFDIELSINPATMQGKQPYSSAAELVGYMKTLNSQMRLDGWWFDFYSDAQTKQPDWVSAAVQYAHQNNQTIGGNVFGNSVPPGSDAVSFVDKPVNSSSFGFDFNTQEVAALHKSSPSTIILGHLQSNPQNGNSTESCVYINDWTTQMRESYNDHWSTQQAPLNFTYMWPLFFPLCPGAFAYDPLSDDENGTTMYAYLQRMALGSAQTTSTSATPTASTNPNKASDSHMQSTSLAFQVLCMVVCVLFAHSM